MSPVQLTSGVSGLGGMPRAASAGEKARGEASFGEALQAQILSQAGVKLSAHAQKRFAERNVQLSEADGARLGEAVDRIQQKGADKSLVLMDDLALVVSARNRVVITALDSTSAKDGIFTGIDSAVII